MPRKAPLTLTLKSDVVPPSDRPQPLSPLELDAVYDELAYWFDWLYIPRDQKPTQELCETILGHELAARLAVTPPLAESKYIN